MILRRPARPLSRRHFLMASASAGLLAACATRPEKAVEVPISLAPTMASLLGAQARPIRRLAAGDPGITALAHRLAQSKISGLGEATHGSHEDARLKSLLVQAMVETHGLRLVLLEANRAGTAELDAYTSAAPTGLLAAEAVKQAPILRVLKTEVMADLLTWLRGWNAVNPDRQVRLMGIDCQASSADAAAAFGALAQVNAGAADALAPGLTPILSDDASGRPHGLMIKSLTRNELLAAEAACRALEANLTDAGLPSAAFAARLAWQGLSAFEHETSDGDTSGAGPDYWSRRDVYMAENVLALSQGEQAALWGHNMHTVGGRPGNGGTGYVPSGAVLRDALGSDYTTLVQDFEDASFLASPAGEGFDAGADPVIIKRSARPDTLNALLASASRTRAWFDLASLPDTALVADWRQTPIGLEWYGASASEVPQPTDIITVPPAGLFDLLVIHPDLTPSRML